MLRIAIIGNGNWGSAAARLIAQNIERHPEFHSELSMWVHEEVYDGMNLSEYINKYHENPKYLPNVVLPKNIRATVSLDMSDIDVAVFCIPHQFISILRKFKFKAGALGISLIKGLIYENNHILTLSEYISGVLKLRCSCLSGPNIAGEVAANVLSESTLGVAKDTDSSIQLKLFSSEYFIVFPTEYTRSIEVSGALKNIVGLACGMVKGLGCGSNTLAMVFRRGICELKQLCEEWNEPINVLDPSCIGDLYTSCNSGRNYKCGVEMGRQNIGYKSYEAEMNGQKLQGPDTARSIVELLGKKRSAYPIFDAVNKICNDNESPSIIIQALKNN